MFMILFQMQGVNPSQVSSHLPSSVPFMVKASPFLLQDNFRLCFKWESHLVSQCNSSVCDLGTRGCLGETRTFVASVLTEDTS